MSVNTEPFDEGRIARLTARIAELEAENGELNGQVDRDSQTIIRLGVSEMEAKLRADRAAARIAELEAERDKWHGDAVTQMRRVIEIADERDGWKRRSAELEAERDKLKDDLARCEAEHQEDTR